MGLSFPIWSLAVYVHCSLSVLPVGGVGVPSLPSCFGLVILSYPLLPLGVSTIPRIGLGPRAVRDARQGRLLAVRDGWKGLPWLIPFSPRHARSHLLFLRLCCSPACNTLPSPGKRPGMARALKLRRSNSPSQSPTWAHHTSPSGPRFL